MPWRPTEPGDFPTLGWLFLDWVTEYLARPDLPYYAPFVATQEQADYALEFYRLSPRTGQRVVRRGVISRSRGWGKSPFTSAFASFEALGPAVPDGWDAAGQPVGMPWAEIRKPLVEIAAVSEQQVDTNTWSPLIDMLTLGPVMREYPGLEPMGTFVALPYGRIQKRTAEARSAKGAPACFVVCDQALALDTPIPTPAGWTTMGALHVGDMVYGSAGPTLVTAAKPTSLDHECFRVTFEDGTSLVASEGHLWQTRIAESLAAAKVRTTGEMARDGRRFRIPAAPAQQRPAADLPVPPYLLGLWLGDGTRGKCEIAVSEADLPAVQEQLAREGVATWPRRYAPSGRQYPGSTPAVNLSFTRAAGFQMANRPAVAKALQAMPCYQDKHVPDNYLTGSIEQRSALLQGLMDSDGHCSPGGRCIFVATSAQLAEAVVTLLRSLGQVTSGPTRRVDERYTSGGVFRVSFTPRAGLVPFRLPRKRERVRGHRRGPDWVTVRSIEPTDRVAVRCIAVAAEDHLFAAGRAGHLTHNTEEWTPSNGGVALFDTLRNNVLKRGGHLMESPNAFTPGRGSVAENSMATYLDIRDARSKGRTTDRGVYFDHREAPPETDPFNADSLMRGLEVAYGDSADIEHCAIHDPPCERPGWVDLGHIAASVLAELDTNMQLARADWLNQITHAADAWIDQPTWAGRFAFAEGREPTVDPLADRDLVTLGFDGSRGKAKGKADATALIGCRITDGHLFELDVWEAPDGEQGKTWSPPIPLIEAAIAAAFDRFRIGAFYADPAKDWRSHVNAWEAKYAGRLVKAPDGKQVKASVNHPFEWWMTGGRSGLIERAVEQLEGAIRNGDMTHDGAYALTKHVLNARRRVRNKKLTLGKEHDYSPNKMDAAVAAVLAWQARLDCVAAGVVQAQEFVAPRRLR